MTTTNDAHLPNGKAMITETGNVTISGFDISGVSVSDGNGAAIRYEDEVKSRAENKARTHKAVVTECCCYRRSGCW